MKELKLEEMTLEQKIGQLFCIRWLWSKQDIDDIPERDDSCTIDDRL